MICQYDVVVEVEDNFGANFGDLDAVGRAAI